MLLFRVRWHCYAISWYLSRRMLLIGTKWHRCAADTPPRHHYPHSPSNRRHRGGALTYVNQRLWRGRSQNDDIAERRWLMKAICCPRARNDDLAERRWLSEVSASPRCPGRAKLQPSSSNPTELTCWRMNESVAPHRHILHTLSLSDAYIYERFGSLRFGLKSSLVVWAIPCKCISKYFFWIRLGSVWFTIQFSWFDSRSWSTMFG
jgi:hypothetical protein